MTSRAIGGTKDEMTSTISTTLRIREMILQGELKPGERVITSGGDQVYPRGLPVGAFGGRADVMDFLAPLGPVYQAGTLSGNPLAMAAGIATLEHILRNHEVSVIISK